MKTAAVLAGMSHSVVFKWIKECESGVVPPDSKLFQFVTRINAAMATAETRFQQLILKAGVGTDKRPGQWQALAWTMERRWPERWRRQDGVMLSGDPHGSPVKLDVEASVTEKPMSEDEMIACMKGVLARIETKKAQVREVETEVSPVTSMPMLEGGA